jgi:DUF971 family protein
MPTDPATTPREIGPSADGAALRILWEDGGVSLFAPHALRVRCPCAQCVDEMTGRRILRPESVPADIAMSAIHYVGRYALQFVWSDGHDTGFYPFDFLRRLGEEGGEP